MMRQHLLGSLSGLLLLWHTEAALCPIGMENGRILDTSISVAGASSGTVRLNKENGVALVLANSTATITIVLPDTNTRIVAFAIQGGGTAPFIAFVESVSLAYQAPNATDFTNIGNFDGANSTDPLTPLVHILSQPIEAQQVRLMALAGSTSAGFFRLELYSDCLFYSSFEGQAGKGVDAASLTNGLTLSLSEPSGTARVENISSDYEALVVRNTGTSNYAQVKPTEALSLSANVGAVRVSLSVASNGLENSAADSISILLLRASVSSETTVLTGAVQQTGLFKVLQTIMEVPTGSAPLHVTVRMRVNNHSTAANEYRLFYIYLDPEILDCGRLGTYFDNSVCRLCDGLIQFQNQTNQTSCLAATQCNNITEHETVPATRSSDRQCLRLTECDLSTQFVIFRETGTTDRQCKNLTDCPPGSFIAALPSEYQDRRCGNCTLGQNFTSVSNQDACQGLSGVCDPATQYLVEAATITSDRQCLALTACNSTQYISRPHTSTSDRLCSSVKSCGVNEYTLVPATPTSDRECASCLLSCNPGFYLSRTCSPDSTNNNNCVACTPGCAECQSAACDLCQSTKIKNQANQCIDGCDAGQYADGNQTCQLCDPLCASCELSSDTCFSCLNPAQGGFTPADPYDYTYLAFTSCVRNCTAIGATLYGDRLSGLCAALRTCASTQFQMEAPTYTSNRICKDVTNCAAGQYPSVPSTATSDRICAACAAGTFDVDAGNAGSAASCVPCPAGMSDHDVDSATPCIACPPGQYDNPALAHVASCALCAAETLTTEFNQTACAPCSTCATDTFETTACTLSGDRVCTACRMCPVDDPMVAACTATRDTQCQTGTETPSAASAARAMALLLMGSVMLVRCISIA